MESMVCGRKRERQRKREREVGERVPALARKNRRGKSGEGGPVGDRLRKEGRLDRNWQNRGKKEKKQNSRMRRIGTSLQTQARTLRSPLIFVFWHAFSSLLRSPSHSSVSILHLHVLFLPYTHHLCLLVFSLKHSLLPRLVFTSFFKSPLFFSFLKNVFPWLLIPPSCSSILSRAPPLSLSFTVFLSVLLLLLFIVGYRRSLCLSLKDYLCSHLDEGFGKGSPSASSFRGPMHGRLAHKGGRVCVSIRVSHVCLCVCACVC